VKFKSELVDRVTLDPKHTIHESPDRHELMLILVVQRAMQTES